MGPRPSSQRNPCLLTSPLARPAPRRDLAAPGAAWDCPLGERVSPGRQRPSLTAAFCLRVPVKEVLPGIIKQGVSCLESQGQDTAGNFLLGVGICRGSAKNPPAPQVSRSGPRVAEGLSSAHSHPLSAYIFHKPTFPGPGQLSPPILLLGSVPATFPSPF